MDQSTGKIVTVCGVDDLQAGEMRIFHPPDHGPLAIYNVGGEFFATDDFCTHDQASLSKEGLLDGYVVECGWHLGAFDVRDGRPVAPPCQTALRTYPVIIEDGRVHVRLDCAAQASFDCDP